MKKMVLMTSLFLMPLASNGQDVSPDYVREKEALLARVCKYYEVRNADGDVLEAAKAKKALIDFKRDHAENMADKAGFQRELVDYLEQRAQNLQEKYETGEAGSLIVYKIKLLLIDAREDLRKLGQ